MSAYGQSTRWNHHNLTSTSIADVGGTGGMRIYRVLADMQSEPRLEDGSGGVNSLSIVRQLTVHYRLCNLRRRICGNASLHCICYSFLRRSLVTCMSEKCQRLQTSKISPNRQRCDALESARKRVREGRKVSNARRILTRPAWIGGRWSDDPRATKLSRPNASKALPRFPSCSLIRSPVGHSGLSSRYPVSFRLQNYLFSPVYIDTNEVRR